MIDVLRAELEQRRWVVERPGCVYRGPADFALREGERFEPSDRHVYELGAPRMCFGNAIVFARLNGWDYVEGYAMAPPRLFGGAIAIFHHAWVAPPGEQLAIDPTWPAPGPAYLGVRFSVERADDCTWNGDASVLDDYHRQWPLLREAWRGEIHGPWPYSDRLEQLDGLRKARS